MKKYQYIFAAGLVVLIAACSDQQKPQLAPAPTGASTVPVKAKPGAKAEVSMEGLMKAVFADQYRAAAKHAVMRLPMKRNRQQLRLYEVKGVASGVLNTGEAVLLTQSDYAQQNTENDNEVIEDEALISLYVLREKAGAWSVYRKQENFMVRGESSGPGSVLFPMLNKEKQVLALASALANDGCPIRTLYFLDVAQFPFRELTGGISLGDTESRNCGGSDADPEKWTHSTWYLAPPKGSGARYADVVVQSVTDTITRTGPAENDTVTRKGGKVIVRYAFDGKQYKVYAGR